MGGGSIGATDLLSTHKECFVTDMAAAPSHLADEVIAQIDHRSVLEPGPRAR